MSDMLTTARSARESLARGLNALQADPNVPPQLLEAAAPIAQAMGALHQIEKSQGQQVQPHANTALTHVRSALSQLQAQPSSHPAVAQALEAVAGSLGLVHSLSRAAAPAAPAAAPPPQQQAPAQAPVAYAAPPPQQAPVAYAATVAQPAPVFPPPAAHAPAPAHVQAPAHVPAPAPRAAPAPPPLNLPAQPVFNPPAAPAGPIAGPSGNDLPVVEAPLGAHSPTNFYKGLSGNDIVDHGGLFVSTYKIPKIGTNVRLRVSLPGGYEFDANAVVRWSREASDGGHDAPPGFGAQFTQISAEARQLIYRYVRNREPLFHDDL